MLLLLWLLYRRLLLSLTSRWLLLIRTRTCATAATSRSLRSCFFSWYNIDQEIEHIALRQRRGDVGSLEGPAFVFFGVDPSAHSELGDEDVAAFCKKYRSFRGDHLNVRIGLHDLLYPGKWEMVVFIIMIFRLKVVYSLLPVCGEDFALVADEALGYLVRRHWDQRLFVFEDVSRICWIYCCTEDNLRWRKLRHIYPTEEPESWRRGPRWHHTVKRNQPCSFCKTLQ